MMLRTCFGCKHHGQPCVAREAFRAKVHGAGITSVKWRCRDRQPKFNVGDAVWATTYANYNSGEDDDSYRGDFPATVVKLIGSCAMVYIKPWAKDQDGVPFEPVANGFCKIPLGRLRARDAEREEVCRHCLMPASQGHDEKYSCPLPVKSVETEEPIF